MALPDAEYGERISRIRDRMGERGLGAVLVWGEPRGSAGLLSATNDIGYLADWPIRQPGTGAALMVVPLDGEPALLVSGPGYARSYARTRTGMEDVRSVPPEQFVDEARRVLADRGAGGGGIGVARLGEIPRWLHAGLTSAFGDDRLEDAAGIFAALRATKSEREIDLLRGSAAVCDLSFEALEAAAGAGVERAAAMEEMEHAARAAGAEFATTWVSSGPLGGEYPRFEPRDTVGTFDRGDLIVAGIQLVHDNYWGHAIRAGVVGEPSAEHRQLFDVVVEAQDAVLERAEPGTELGALHSAVRSVYAEAGYEGSFRSLHGLGLGYGGSPELPQPGRDLDPSAASTELEPGMVFEVHPNVRGGPGDDRFAAIGDMVALTAEGPERLTGFPRGLFGC